MKLSISFVPIRKIKPSASRWNFSDDAINQAARLIVDGEGVIINPIVLRREDGLESYEVIDGNFEYYAAARASEIEPQRCETTAAFIAEHPEDEAMIRQQIHLFRNGKEHSTQPRSTHDVNTFDVNTFDVNADVNNRLHDLESRQATLEARQLSLEAHNIQEIKRQLDELKTRIPRRTNLLDEFNQADHTELLHRVKAAGLVGKNAEKIVEMIEYERQYKTFESLKDIVTRVKGLTYEKMVDLVENW